MFSLSISIESIVLKPSESKAQIRVQNGLSIEDLGISVLIEG